MGAPWGSLAQGLTQGYITGSQLQQQKQELALKEKIANAQLFAEERTSAIELQKQKLAQETQELTNSMTLGNKYFEGLKNISNPMAKQEYLKGIEDMPWFKKASPEVQSAFSGMAKSGVGDVDTFMKLYSNFQKSFEDGDQNGMASSLMGMNAVFGSDPSMAPLLKQANELAGIKMPTQKETSVGSLLREKKSFAPGSEEERIYNQAIQKEITPSKGITVNTGNMTKPTQSLLEKNLYSYQGEIQELKDIQNKFDENMLNYPNLTSTNLSNIQNKLGLKISPEKQKELENFTNTVVSAARMSNQHIKNLAGSQVTKSEAERVLVELPTINKGLVGRYFKNHSPVEFKQILDNNIKYSIKAANRAAYALQKGRVITNDNGDTVAFLDENGKNLSLDDKRFDNTNMEAVNSDMAEQASQIATQLKEQNPGMSDEQIEAETLKILGIE